MAKLRLATTFTGIGAQELGIERSGAFGEVEVVATCETDTDAIISYAAIHNGLTPKMVEEYSEYPSREEMTDELLEKNIGYDWNKNKPYDWKKKIKSKSNDIEKAWLACKLNKNVGDICKVQHFPTCDLFTYSSPCQSYSIAGRQDGNKITCQDCGHEFNPFDYDVKDRYSCPNCGSVNITSTRSGLMAEVERIILDMVREDRAPRYLLQENVDALVSKKFMPDFENWIGRLDRLGYNTYWTVMNAKECNIPQNRRRVFSLSIRKDIDNGKFTWPLPFDGGLRLKDVLLDNVDEKYYITNPKAQKLIDDLIENGTLEPTETDGVKAIPKEVVDKLAETQKQDEFDDLF